MTGSLAGILGASLLGSAHCAAMCGGFVCVYASDSRALRGHFLYNGGRLISYLLLGLVAGLAGSGLNHVGAVAGFGSAAAIVAGVLMVIWGASTIATYAGFRIPLRSPSTPQRLIGGALARLQALPTGTRALAMGLLTTLLPCGWLYVFVAAAGATGSVVTAATVMFVFWLGTVPAMMAVGFGAQRLFGSFRNRLPIASAAVVVVIGLLTLTGRLSMMSGPHGH